jgi:hypothetical protein
VIHKENRPIHKVPPCAHNFVVRLSGEKVRNRCQYVCMCVHEPGLEETVMGVYTCVTLYAAVEKDKTHRESH